MAVFKTLALLSVLALCGAQSHHKVEKMYMSRKMSSDLAPEATGYIYRSDSNGPTSYIQLGHGAVNHHMNGYPQAAPQVQPQTFGSYGYVPVPQYTDGKLYQPPSPVYPIPTYAKPATVANIQINHGVGPSAPNKKSEEENSSEEKEETNDDDESAGDDEGFDSDEGQDYADKINYNYEAIGKSPSYSEDFESDTGSNHGNVAAHGDHGAFSNGGGKSFGSEGYSSHGDKGDKGYKSGSSYEKGQVGKHFKDGHKGQYSDESGHKSGHLDDASHYSKNHAAAKGYKAGDFSEKKGHKKGSKTTGFHNVYHKDEYKKEHNFYDDADDSGHFKKNGKFGSDHHSAEGGHKKGAKHDSAYHHDGNGKSGFTDKGHIDEAHKGHAGKAGGEKYYKNYSDYAKKGGSSEGKEYGHSEKH